MAKAQMLSRLEKTVWVKVKIRYFAMKDAFHSGRPIMEKLHKIILSRHMSVTDKPNIHRQTGLNHVRQVIYRNKFET